MKLPAAVLYTQIATDQVVMTMVVVGGDVVVGGGGGDGGDGDGDGDDDDDDDDDGDYDDGTGL